MLSLDIQNVWKNYPSGKKDKIAVLKGLSLRVERGERVAVMGPSGSGKTTLLNIVSGIDRPDTGSVWVEGESLSGMDAGEIALFRRRRLGMVFQDYNLIECLTVRENVLLPMILEKATREEQDERAAKILQILGIADLQEKNVTDISGGEKQRAAIGRALVNDPAILLADEPTGNLDTKSTREVMKTIAQVNREFGTSVLLVTHDPFVASCCGRAVFLKDGYFAADIERTGGRVKFLDLITQELAEMGGGQDDIL